MLIAFKDSVYVYFFLILAVWGCRSNESQYSRDSSLFQFVKNGNSLEANDPHFEEFKYIKSLSDYKDLQSQTKLIIDYQNKDFEHVTQKSELEYLGLRNAFLQAFISDSIILEIKRKIEELDTKHFEDQWYRSKYVGLYLSRRIDDIDQAFYSSEVNYHISNNLSRFGNEKGELLNFNLRKPYFVNLLRNGKATEAFFNCQIEKLGAHTLFDSVNRDLLNAYKLAELGDSKGALALLNKRKLNLEWSMAKNWMLLHGALEVSSNPVRSRELFEETYALFDNVDCHYIKIIPVLYLMLLADSTDELEKEISKLEDLYPCHLEIGSYAEFIGIDFYMDNPFFKSTAEERIKSLNRREELANRIWTGDKSFHIQDLYASLAIKKLAVYKSSKSLLDETSPLDIISLFAETKAIELKRKRYADADFLLSEDQRVKQDRINEILQLTNEFQDTSYDGDPIYIELYPLLLEQKEWEAEYRKTQEIKRAADTLDLSTISKLNTHSVLEFIKYEDAYWYYFLHNDEISIHTAEANTIDSLILALQDGLENRSSLEQTQDELRAALFAEITFESEQVLILPDGQLSNLPFELLLPYTDIHYHFDAAEYSQYDTLQLEPDILICSYSDDETINSTGKLRYPELAIGWKEAQEIEQIFGPENSQLVAGAQFTKATLDQTAKFPILHFSTHASSDQEKRLDNYLLVRDASGEAQRMYSYEIESLPDVPSVVVLSACETGTGVHRHGAGTFSISRAFFQQGSEAVVKTLWQVNEQATFRFMSQLYKFWLSGLSLDEAIAATKKSIQSDSLYSHPYYWAGFILEGNPYIKLSTIQ